MKPDPIRWSDSRSRMPAELRRALVALRDQPVDEAAVRELTARLLQDATLAEPSRRTRASSRLSSAATLGLVVGALALLGPGAQQRHTPPQPSAAAPAAPSRAPASAEPPPAPPQPSAAEAPPVAAKHPAPAHPRGPAKPADELTLLTQAQAALAHDAARTLERTSAHARLYPHGTFEQEREVLAIEALFALARRVEARARADDFLAHHPDSPHALGLRALLERQPNDARRAR